MRNLVTPLLACLLLGLGHVQSASAGWSVARQGQFEVWCCCELAGSPGTPQQVARQCEQLRAEIAQTWWGDEAPRWDRPCVVVIHATAKAYEAAVGTGARGTLGSTTVALAEGRVVSRRIDLRGDQADWRQNSLPHELTHAVIADAFADTELPAWADEGIATLADSAAKRAGHVGDLNRALDLGQGRSLVELLSGKIPASTSARQLFYGQSLSLVQLLVERSSAREFLAFVRQAGRTGYDAALRDCYGIHGVAELEQAWLAHIDRQAQLLASAR